MKNIEDFEPSLLQDNLDIIMDTIELQQDKETRETIQNNTDNIVNESETDLIKNL